MNFKNFLKNKYSKTQIYTLLFQVKYKSFHKCIDNFSQLIIFLINKIENK